MSIKFLSLIVMLTSLMLLFQNCQKEGCNDEVVYKNHELADWALEKYPYSGNETLIFYEIDKGDTTELVFKPRLSYDTVLTSTRWYEAGNGETCPGYVTYKQSHGDVFYCAKRNWYFRTSQHAANGQPVKYEFFQTARPEYEYNFEIKFYPERADYVRENKPIGAHEYMGDTTINNIIYFSIYRRNVSDNEKVLIGLIDGLIDWKHINGNDYELQLKEIIE